MIVSTTSASALRPPLRDPWFLILVCMDPLAAGGKDCQAALGSGPPTSGTNTPMELTIKETAVLLGKSPRTVRHMARTGRLPARQVDSRLPAPKAVVRGS